MTERSRADTSIIRFCSVSQKVMYNHSHGIQRTKTFSPCWIKFALQTSKILCQCHPTVKPRRNAVPSKDHNQCAIPSFPKTEECCLPIPANEIGVNDAVHYRRYILFLVILVGRVRKYAGDHPEDAQMHKTNLNECGSFSLISQFNQIFHISWYL